MTGAEQARQALLARLLRGDGAGADAIPRRRPGELVPLLPAQRRIWLMDLLGGGAVYNVYLAARLRGPLDIPALRHALADLAERHEALRTSVITTGGTPRQVIASAGTVPLTVTELPTPRAVRPGQAERLLAEMARHPFAPGAPLVRAELLRHGDEEHHLMLLAHHLVTDAWSLRTLVTDLDELYAARRQGRPHRLAPVPLSQADVACWLARRPAQERGLRFWTELLAPPLPVLDLPVDHPRPAVAAHHGAHCAQALSPGLSSAIRERAAERGGTVFMALLAGWAALLHRWTDQDDVVVGVPSTGRERAELHEVVGQFASTVALRIDLSGRPHFRGLVRAVRDLLLAAHPHMTVPFEDVVQALRPGRDLSRNPLFQASFVMEEEPVELDRLSDLDVTPVPLHNGTAKFDLTLFVTDRGGHFDLTLEYDTAIFAASTAERLVRTYRNLLQAAFADPDRPVGTLPLRSTGQRGTVSGPAVPRPEIGIHELVATRGGRDGTALIAGDRAVSRSELDLRAGRLAAYLRERGVGPETAVGLCLRRGVDLVTSVLAVWRAGGAFLAIDPAHPPDRARRLAERAGVPVVVTTSPLRRAALGAVPQARCVELDVEAAAIGSMAPLPAGAAPGGARAAYVVQTSGSSGRPKGIMATHSGVVNYLSYVVEEFGLGPGDVVLQLPSIAFDAAIRDTVAPLVAGATLVLTDEETAADPRSVLRECAARGVTCLLSVVPARLEELSRAAGPGWARDRSRLRLLLVSGERLRWSDVRRVRAALGPSMTVVNQYGPTETTMTSTFHRIRPAEDGAGEVPIGRPIPNVEVEIVDRWGMPAAPGVPGELFLSGAGVARGYLGDPGLTAERFGPAPGGRRRYRTGDRVRELPGGRLAFLRRADDLIKHRGTRIDPAEVEEALRAVDGVREAAVVVRGSAGSSSLVAYFTGSDTVTMAAVRRELMGRLPAALLPDQCHRLESLPRTPNGKVDRRRLASADGVPVGEPAAPDGTGRPPSTEREREVARIWAEVLHRGEVPVEADFFELGGHSLTAVVLIDRLARRWGAEIALTDLFLRPTVAALAEWLDERAAGRPGDGCLVRLRAGAHDPPLFLVHPLSGDLLCYRYVLPALREGRAVYGLQSAAGPASARPADRQDSVEQMAGRYARAVQQIDATGPYDLAGWSFGGLVALEMARMLGEAGGEVRRLVLLDPLLDPSLDPPPDGVEEEVTPEEARQILLYQARGTGWDPADSPTMHGLVDALLANARARRYYRPGGPVEVDLTLVQATEAHPVLKARNAADPAQWQARTRGRVLLHRVATNHFDLLDGPNAPAIAAVLDGLATLTPVSGSCQ